MSATYLGSYSDRLWNVRSLNPAVYIPGSCTLQTPTGPQTFTRLLDHRRTLNDFRRVLTMQNYATGRYLGVVDEHTALGDQKYNGLVLSVQRRSANGITAGANYTLSKCTGLPTQGGTTPNVELRLRRSDEPGLRLRPVRHRPPAQLQHDAPARRRRSSTNTALRAGWRRTGACRASSAPTRARRSR